MANQILKTLINIDVSDLAKAEKFYTQALGLKVGRRFGESGVELLGAGSPIYLLENKDGSQPIDGLPIRRDYSRHWTPVHLDFVVEGIEAAVARVLVAGASLENPIESRRWGKIAVFADPFGNGFCLLEFNELGYDAIATKPAQS